MFKFKFNFFSKNKDDDDKDKQNFKKHMSEEVKETFKVIKALSKEEIFNETFNIKKGYLKGDIRKMPLSTISDDLPKKCKCVMFNTVSDTETHVINFEEFFNLKDDSEYYNYQSKTYQETVFCKIIYAENGEIQELKVPAYDSYTPYDPNEPADPENPEIKKTDPNPYSVYTDKGHIQKMVNTYEAHSRESVNILKEYFNIPESTFELNSEDSFNNFKFK